MPESRNRSKMYHISLRRNVTEESQRRQLVWYTILHIKDSESGEALDDVSSWREEDGSEYMVGAKLCTEQRKQLEALLQKYQDVLKSKPG